MATDERTEQEHKHTPEITANGVYCTGCHKRLKCSMCGSWERHHVVYVIEHGVCVS